MSLKNQVQLIVYPNRIGTNLHDLYKAVTPLKHEVKGLHILPLFPSNADAGFSPLTHMEVDPEYGTLEDLKKITQEFDLCLDLVLNHISDQSPEFQDFIAHGHDSEYAEMFIDIDKLGPITKEDLAKIHIRKEKEPFREVTLADGKKLWVWSTFTDQQIDLNYESKKTYELMERYMRFMMEEMGVNLFRLDAFGYITKRLGTTCFLIEPETYDKLKWFRDIARSGGAEILPEVHDHFSYQDAITDRDMYSYAFALPPLTLYAFLEKSSKYLKNWLRTADYNQITVLDTHDGICITDVEDLLPEPNIKKLVANVEDRSGDTITRGNAGNLHSVGAIYQLTCTYYDALKRNDDAMVGARAIQFFTPGIPQVYYHGLVAGTNNFDLANETGESREINRTYYSLDEWKEAIEHPVAKRTRTLMKFRNEYPAFNGRFELMTSEDTEVRMKWLKDNLWCELEVDLITLKGVITYIDEANKREKKFEI